LPIKQIELEKNGRRCASAIRRDNYHTTKHGFVNARQADFLQKNLLAVNPDKKSLKEFGVRAHLVISGNWRRHFDSLERNYE
jgi:hypothetical protein